jgi:1,4-alpha-glucan branching enzyme
MELRDRIGAWPTPDGCFFRVWAPHAIQVTVLARFGADWQTAGPLVQGPLTLAGGYWSGIVPGVLPGHLYRFQIEEPDGTSFETLDPAARRALDSELTRQDPSNRNACVVLSDDLFPWAAFTTPRFEDFLIYQFHVGTFAGFGDGLNKLEATFHDIEGKLPYIHALGFNCIQPLPVQEFALDRSWGYNPASFFSPESSYGTPDDLKHLVNAAHQQGLAVIFDVVYNHAGPGDNSLWEFDGYTNEGGIYFEGGQMTDWGRGPAWWKVEVQDFFYQNAHMYFEEYRADGLRFDATTQINGNHLKIVMDRLRQEFPDKYFIAEHLPDNPWIIDAGNFCATWVSRSHKECQRALAGQDPLNKVKGFLGWDGYEHAWNLVKYTLGSHDDVGDEENGNAENGLTNWDSAHRYLVDKLGSRSDWTARAKCRLAWALNVTMPGTPMLFMGSECLMASPLVSWGYWDDGPDEHGDHRFNWAAVDDQPGTDMRRLVAACNALRWEHPALRADNLSIPHEDHDNQVLGFLRQFSDDVVLVIVNLGETDFGSHEYGVATGGQEGQWTQILCTQDAEFGGWDGAGNAYYEPWTQGDGRIYINLPKWSVVVFRRK